MKSWAGYNKRFLEELLGLRLSLVETVLIGTLALMCVISAVDAMSGHNVGSYEQVKMAKLQAQQEMMALRKAN